MVSNDIRQALELLRQAAHEVDPKEFFGRDAARLTEDAAEVERLGVTLSAPHASPKR